MNDLDKTTARHPGRSLLHPGAGEHGEDVAVPTTILIDKYGVVRALFRPTNVASRFSAREVLAAVDKKLAVP